MNLQLLTDMGRMNGQWPWEDATHCSAAARAAPRAGRSWLVNTAKLHELDPQAYLTDVLERIVSGRTKSHQLYELLAWNWKAARQRTAQAVA